MVDVITGVDGSVEKASEKVSDLTKAASDYGKQVIKNSKNLVFAEKEAQLAEARNVGLKESFDVQAELQRQIRDDTSKSIEDRIAANNRLGEVLKEQSDLMKEEAQNVVNAAQARFNLTGKLEDEVALIQAKNELAAVEATVTGFVSEQLVNENALRQEKLELMNELKLIGESEFERQRLEAEIEREEAIAKIEREVSDEETKNELLAAARQRYSDQIAEIDQSEADAKDKARQEEIAADLAATEAKIGFAKGALGALQGLAKEGSASAKALAVGQTILDALPILTRRRLLPTWKPVTPRPNSSGTMFWPGNGPTGFSLIRATNPSRLRFTVRPGSARSGGRFCQFRPGPRQATNPSPNRSAPPRPRARSALRLAPTRSPG